MSERVDDPPSPYAGYVSYSDYSRLAARVAELEAENAKLRACVQPGGMLTCPFCLEGDFDKEGLRRHLSGLPMSGWSCDAARAEVGE